MTDHADVINEFKQVKLMTRKFDREPGDSLAMELRDALRYLADAVGESQIHDAATDLATRYDEWLGAVTDPLYFDKKKEFGDLSGWPDIDTSTEEIGDLLLEFGYGEDVFAD